MQKKIRWRKFFLKNGAIYLELNELNAHEINLRLIFGRIAGWRRGEGAQSKEIVTHTDKVWKKVFDYDKLKKKTSISEIRTKMHLLRPFISLIAINKLIKH